MEIIRVLCYDNALCVKLYWAGTIWANEMNLHLNGPQRKEMIYVLGYYSALEGYTGVGTVWANEMNPCASQGVQRSDITCVLGNDVALYIRLYWTDDNLS